MIDFASCFGPINGVTPGELCGLVEVYGYDPVTA